MVACRRISTLHVRLVKTKDPNALRDLLLSSASNTASLSYARAVFGDHAPLAHPFPWNAIIRAHALAPPYAPDALALFAAMHRHGVPPDCYTFPLVLRACSLHPSPHSGFLSGAASHALASKLGLLASTVHARNALLAFYGRHGFLDNAMQVFAEIPRRERDVVSWSTLVDGLASSGYHAEALEAFRLMQATGVRPDEAAMVSAVWAAENLDVPELATWVYCYVRRGGLRMTVALGSALVAALARCGRITLAAEMFDVMPERNLITWTAMMNGLRAHGRGREALDMFYRMVEDGFKPDHVAFIGALTACSHGGLVEEGTRLFESMAHGHGVAPGMEHYGCMVDLMGRAGMVVEAREFVERMPVRPGPVIWRTLLGACVSHGYVELAEHVRGKIAEMEPGHDGDYVLLSNVYGGIGRWVDKAGVRSEMRDLRVAKTPGLSIPSL